MFLIVASLLPSVPTWISAQGEETSRDTNMTVHMRLKCKTPPLRRYIHIKGSHRVRAPTEYELRSGPRFNTDEGLNYEAPNDQILIVYPVDR